MPADLVVPDVPSDVRASVSEHLGAGKSSGGTRQRASSRHAEPDEHAIEDGLAWLRDHQAEDGRWSADGFMHENALGRSCGCDGAGIPGGDVQATGLALLAFLGNSNTTRQGPHKQVVSRGIEWLRGQRDGLTGRIGDRFRRGPDDELAIASLALCEAYYFSRNPLIQRSAREAVERLVREQELEGNGSGQTGWTVLTLHSASVSGLFAQFELPEAAIPRQIGFDRAAFCLESNTDIPVGALMLLEGPSFPAAIAESTRNELALKIEARRPSCMDGLDLERALFDSLALRFLDRRSCPMWQGVLARDLIDAQSDKGDTSGSWYPARGADHPGGRIRSTALALLALEVPYRHVRVLPTRRPKATEPR